MTAGIMGSEVLPKLTGYYRTDIATDYEDSDTGRRLVRRIPQRRLDNPEEMDGAILMLAFSLGNLRC